MATSIPKTHKAAIFKSKGGPLSLEDVDTPSPKEGEILVKVLATGICYSDHVVQEEMMGPLPRIPGHETIGDVVAVGDGEKKWKVGDRVGAPWHGGHDGTCNQCQAGLFQMCDKQAINGVSKDGGYAEYILLRSESVARIPSSLDPSDYAPFLCAGVTVFNGMRQMDIPKGSLVAIQGLGGLGHLAVQYANKMGYRVVALSSGGEKEGFARDLGAHEYVDGSKTPHHEALQKLGGAALVVSTAPNPSIMGDLIKGLAAKGKLLLLSPSGDVTISTLALVVRGISVHGWPSGHAQDSEEAIEFAMKHDIKCLVEKFPLAEANKAFEHMLGGKARFRSVLVME